jgi:adenine/guanine/hypoxanthine permease
MYAAINGTVAILVLLSGGRLEPCQYDLKEYWTWKGGGRPPWLIRALRKFKTKRGVESDRSVMRDNDSSAGSGAGSSTKDDTLVVGQRPVSPLAMPESNGRWGV